MRGVVAEADAYRPQLRLEYALLIPCLVPSCPATASPAPDRTNTVERVRLPSPPAGGPLDMTVSAFRLRSANLGRPEARLPQRFAVAVVGFFSGDIDPNVVPTSATQVWYRTVWYLYRTWFTGTGKGQERNRGDGAGWQ